MTKSTRLVLAEFNQIQIPQLLEAMYAGVRAYNAGPNKYTTSKLWSNPVASDEYKKCGLFIAGCLAFLQENPERYKAQICFLYLALKKSENDIWRVVLGEIAKQIPYNLEQTAAQAEEKGKEQTLCYARVVLQKLHLSNKTIAKRVDEVYATIAPGLFKSTEKEGLIGTDKANSGWSWLELVVFQNFITPVFMDELKRAAEADVLDSMEPLATDYLVKRINLVSRMAAYVAAYNQNKDGLELEKARCYSRPEGRLDEFIKSGVVAKWIKSTDEASKRYPELLPPAFLGKIPEYFNKKIFDALKEQMWAMIAAPDFNQLERRRAIYGALLFTKLQSLAEAPLVRYPHSAEDSKDSYEVKLNEWLKHNFELYRTRDQVPERLSYSPISTSSSSSSASSSSKQKDSPPTTDEKKPTASESKRPAINNQAIPIFLAAPRIKAFSFSELLTDLQTGINNYLTQSKANHQGNARAIIVQQSLEFFAKDVALFSTEIGLIYLAIKKLNSTLYKNYIAALVAPKTQFKVQRLEEKGTEDLDCVEECLRRTYGLSEEEIINYTPDLKVKIGSQLRGVERSSIIAHESEFTTKTVHFALELLISPLMAVKIIKALDRDDLTFPKGLKDYHNYRKEIADKISYIQRYKRSSEHRFYAVYDGSEYHHPKNNDSFDRLSHQLQSDKSKNRGLELTYRSLTITDSAMKVLRKIKILLQDKASLANVQQEGNAVIECKQTGAETLNGLGNAAEQRNARKLEDIYQIFMDLSVDDQLIAILALLVNPQLCGNYFRTKNIFDFDYRDDKEYADFSRYGNFIYAYLIKNRSMFFFNYSVLRNMVQQIAEMLDTDFLLKDKRQYIIETLLLGRGLALTELSPLEGQCVSDRLADEEKSSEPKADYILTGFLGKWMEDYFPSVPVSAPPMVVVLNSPPPMQFEIVPQQQINVAPQSIALSAPPVQPQQEPQPLNDPPILPPNISAPPQPNNAPTPSPNVEVVPMPSPESVPLVPEPEPGELEQKHSALPNISCANDDSGDEGQSQPLVRTNSSEGLSDNNSTKGSVSVHPQGMIISSGGVTLTIDPTVKVEMQLTNSGFTVNSKYFSFQFFTSAEPATPPLSAELQQKISLQNVMK